MYKKQSMSIRFEISDNYKNWLFFYNQSAKISEIENAQQEITNDNFLLKQIESVIATNKAENEKLNTRFNSIKKNFEKETDGLREKTEKCNM